MKCKPNTEMWSAGFKAQGHWYGGETQAYYHTRTIFAVYTHSVQYEKK